MRHKREQKMDLGEEGKEKSTSTKVLLSQMREREREREDKGLKRQPRDLRTNRETSLRRQ